MTRLGIRIDAYRFGAELTPADSGSAHGIDAGGALLVRPDGFVAWSTTRTSTDPTAGTSTGNPSPGGVDRFSIHPRPGADSIHMFRHLDGSDTGQVLQGATAQPMVSQGHDNNEQRH